MPGVQLKNMQVKAETAAVGHVMWETDIRKVKLREGNRTILSRKIGSASIAEAFPTSKVTRSRCLGLNSY
jgi:hypothetical protein